MAITQYATMKKYLTSIGKAVSCANYLVIDHIDDVETKFTLHDLFISFGGIDHGSINLDRALKLELAPLTSKLWRGNNLGSKWLLNGCLDGLLLSYGRT